MDEDKKFRNFYFNFRYLGEKHSLISRSRKFDKGKIFFSFMKGINLQY